MNSIDVVNWYLAANVLLVVVALQSQLALTANRRLRRPFRFRHLLVAGYTATLAALLLPSIEFRVATELFPRTAQIWSADTMRAVELAGTSDTAAVVVAATDRSVSLADLSLLAVWALGIGIVSMLIRAARDWIVTWRIVRDAVAIRRRGRAVVLVSSSIDIPFAFWSPTLRRIVLPMRMIDRPRELRVALRHEAQHHRQGDTSALYLFLMLRAIFFWNPCAHLLVRRMRDMQEHACDEALAMRSDGVAQEYCRCLVSIAEASVEPSLIHAGMAGRTSLGLRLASILRAAAPHRSAKLATGISAMAVASMAVLSLAIAAPIADRRISLQDAEIMAANAQRIESFPVSVNERVVRELNRMLGTPDGRASLQAALTRMDTHRELVSRELTRYGLPQALLAVPLVESGYRNLPQGRDARHGAGIWMFIKPTARSFGLVVDEQRDDRLDVVIETDAAMRMFAALHARFGDWNLALLAYNAGERRVSDAMREAGSRDVWELIRRGHENDPNYLPRVIATILILSNPDLLERERPRAFRVPREGIA